ncbi:hypothetical protein [Pontibacter harenae]|uniref:hypothetical protein n=1 Tax=Pontibacter harenae TaxID=2894083 RepID=UPI001E52F61D|nr:hypothetical protein [Pontibacter harenae]MCC9167230.1 hypothetical protein [Pontibacter harenae]
MENNTSQNQGNNKEQKGQQGGGEGMLTLLQPHDMSRTVESALHVFQGRHDKLPDLMQDVGQILLKATKRFSTTQLIVAAGALTIGAILITRYGPEGVEVEQ